MPLPKEIELARVVAMPTYVLIVNSHMRELLYEAVGRMLKTMKPDQYENWQHYELTRARAEQAIEELKKA